MTGVKLSLRRSWELGEQIGRGGFGRVYAAISGDGEEAVAKLIPKAPGAERELLFVDLGDARNVVPIIDSGETDENWVLVMPRAETSLREHLDKSADSLAPSDVAPILSDIATALVDLEGRVVHRDLKPENVLLLNGAWCLADFGISRYAEATTAPDTQKFALSPPYAAPERWRNERATSATDIYALGVMGFEMVQRRRPFAGPKMEDFREQHLHDEPPPLDGVPSRLASLLEECLYKAAAARPAPSNLLARLAKATESSGSAGLSKLQEAQLSEVARQGQHAQAASRAMTEAERRESLFDAAQQGARRISESLQAFVDEGAPASKFHPSPDGGGRFRLNKAELLMSSTRRTASSPWGGWEAPAFDVIAHASLGIRFPADQFGYEGRSHSLWYCDAQEAARYGWYETSFMTSAFSGVRGRQNPFALDPGENSAKALWPGMAEFQLAWPFTRLDVGDLEEFVDRWGGWFADAAQGRLQHPGTMPERSPQGSWRGI
jgi:eukaryotic-like serine/threonine-protein kinase